MPNNSEKIVLPRPMPENVDDGVEDPKKADSDSDDAFGDIEIVIDDDEVEAEDNRNPSGRKF